MRSMFSKDFWRPDNLRTTWEYKTIAFLLRMFVALCVIVYLGITSSFVWPWLQATYARSQPAEQFEELVERAIKTDDFKWAYRWLQSRPRAEAPQHAQVVESHISDIPPVFLSVLAHASRADNNADQTRFWLMYTQYRMRFDLIRCGRSELIERYGNMQLAINTLHGQPDELAEVNRDPKQMATLLQKVLDYDAQHPARNTPTLVCKNMAPLLQGQGVTILPQESWANIRHTLRLTTEYAISEMAADQSTTPPQQPEVP